MEVEKLYERLKMGGVTEIAQYLNVSTRRDTLFVFSLRLNVPVTLSWQTYSLALILAAMEGFNIKMYCSFDRKDIKGHKHCTEQRQWYAHILFSSVSTTGWFFIIFEQLKHFMLLMKISVKQMLRGIQCVSESSQRLLVCSDLNKDQMNTYNHYV